MRRSWRGDRHPHRPRRRQHRPAPNPLFQPARVGGHPRLLSATVRGASDLRRKDRALNRELVNLPGHLVEQEFGGVQGACLIAEREDLVVALAI